MLQLNKGRFKRGLFITVCCPLLKFSEKADELSQQTWKQKAYITLNQSLGDDLLLLLGEKVQLR